MMDLIEKYKQLEASLLLIIKDLPVETKLKIAKTLMADCGHTFDTVYDEKFNGWNYDMSAMPKDKMLLLCYNKRSPSVDVWWNGERSNAAAVGGYAWKLAPEPAEVKK